MQYDVPPILCPSSANQILSSRMHEIRIELDSLRRLANHIPVLHCSVSDVKSSFKTLLTIERQVIRRSAKFRFFSRLGSFILRLICIFVYFRISKLLIVSRRAHVVVIVKVK